MKSFTCFPAFVMSFCILVMSCSKTNSSTPSIPSAGTDSVTALLISGTWVISSMSEQKEDNTQSFAGYVFTFSKDGKLSASKNSVAVQGSWHYSPAVTYYGSSSKDAISISMGADNPFRRLTKTWNLVSVTSALLKLENPEIAEAEQVQFQNDRT